MVAPWAAIFACRLRTFVAVGTGCVCCRLAAARAGGSVCDPKRAGCVFYDEVVGLASPSQPRRTAAWWTLGSLYEGRQRACAAVVPVGPRYLRNTPSPFPSLSSPSSIQGPSGQGKTRQQRADDDLDPGVVCMRVELLLPADFLGQIARAQRIAAGKEEVLAGPGLLRVDAAEERERRRGHDFAQPCRDGCDAVAFVVRLCLTLAQPLARAREIQAGAASAQRRLRRGARLATRRHTCAASLALANLCM